jgi:hypothetical protein
MPVINIHGLGDRAMEALRRRAVDEGVSVECLAIRLIEQGLGLRVGGSSLQNRHSDLDALAGCWSRREGVAFERATAPLAQVDANLWQ